MSALSGEFNIVKDDANQISKITDSITRESSLKTVKIVIISIFNRNSNVITPNTLPAPPAKYN